MKTALQELIEFIELNIDDNDFIKHQVLEEADKALEKEKEQIINAHINGQSEFDMLQFRDINKTLSDNYYNQTYNQNK